MDPSTDIDERAEKCLRNLIAAKDYKTLFLQGGCFHFALKSFLHHIGRLHCACADVQGLEIEHVFVVVTGNIIFDRCGVRPLTDLQTVDGLSLLSNRSISEEDVRSGIKKKRLPCDLHEQIYNIAEQEIERLRPSSRGI